MNEKIEYLIEIIKNVKNWFSLLMIYMGFNKRIKLMLKNGISFNLTKSNLILAYYLIKIISGSKAILRNQHSYKALVDNSEVVFSLTDELSIYKAYVTSCIINKLNAKIRENFCEFYFKGKKLKYFFNKNDFSSIAGLLTTFVVEQYRALNVQGKIVANIGAGYGDTTLYFALKGAKRIYAYEPIPSVVELLRKNIEVNGFSDIVEIYPCAVSVTKGIGKLKVSKTATNSASLKYDVKRSDVIEIPVEIVTPPRNVDVVKFNCEGCEYDIILEWLQNKLYKEIIINYHEDYKPLERKLKKLSYKTKIYPCWHILYAY